MLKTITEYEINFDYEYSVQCLLIVVKYDILDVLNTAQ